MHQAHWQRHWRQSPAACLQGRADHTRRPMQEAADPQQCFQRATPGTHAGRPFERATAPAAAGSSSERAPGQVVQGRNKETMYRSNAQEESGHLEHQENLYNKRFYEKGGAPGGQPP